MFTLVKDIVIIHPEFDDEISKTLLTKFKKYKKIIFSNYYLKESENIVNGNIKKSKNNKNSNTDIKIEQEYHDIYVKPKYKSNFYVEYEQEYTSNNLYLKKSSFNKPIDNNLPEHIISLILGWFFNKSVDNLPLTLKEITFGHEFNQPVDNLPFTLENISFGYSFNQYIDNLPNSLKLISLGYSFNQSIDDLPNTLEKIFLGKIFDFPINNLPISLVEITIKSNYQRNDIYRLPKNIQKITFIIGNESYHKLDIYTIDNIKYKFNCKIVFY